MANQPLLT